jgi:hypothetical protein
MDTSSYSDALCVIYSESMSNGKPSNVYISLGKAALACRDYSFPMQALTACSEIAHIGFQSPALIRFVMDGVSEFVRASGACRGALMRVVASASFRSWASANEAGSVCPRLCAVRRWSALPSERTLLAAGLVFVADRMRMFRCVEFISSLTPACTGARASSTPFSVGRYCVCVLDGASYPRSDLQPLNHRDHSRVFLCEGPSD